MVNTGLAIIFGEITTEAYVDMAQIVRDTIRSIGYDNPDWGFDYRACSVMVAIDEQSGDINQGVDREDGEQGAGDQGLMFGYACDETDELMPMPIMYSHKLVEELAAVRKSDDNAIGFLGPDSKSQVTVRYEDDRPVAIDAVVVSTQHLESATRADLEEVVHGVVGDVIPGELLHDDTKYHINPTGKFVLGGPRADAGLTGRKIIVDTYGGMGRHGGGAFSGKDPSKVDRSAAYMTRYIAKNIVAAGLARRAEVQLAYAIGVAEPVSVMVNTFDTATVDEDKIAEAVREFFPLKPAGIIEHLELLRPIYRDTAAYGHFGRPKFRWEQTDKAELLEDALK